MSGGDLAGLGCWYIGNVSFHPFALAQRHHHSGPDMAITSAAPPVSHGSSHLSGTYYIQFSRLKHCVTVPLGIGNLALPTSMTRIGCL